MIKGNSFEVGAFSAFPHNDFLYSFSGISIQDTAKSVVSGPSSVLRVPKAKINISDTVTVDRQRLERLFKVAEERERKISKPKVITPLSEVDSTALTFQGSTSRIYSDFQLSFQKLPNYNIGSANDNFLLNISEKTFDIHYKVKDTIPLNATSVTLSSPRPAEPTGFEGKNRDSDSNGWYVFVLLLSLSIFAWGKSLYQKYLLQIIYSVYNYQTSIQLFRDKNALFRNLSIILQFLFPINLGLFFYFLIEYYQLKHVSEYPIANIGLYSFFVFVFFRLKSLFYKFLGVVFKVQDDFNEIQHHMNIFIQTLGVILLPFIISIPFLNESIKSYFLIGLFVIIGVFVLLFFLRGFQIVSRKQVPFFFLILYLCAVEILPIVLLTKVSYSII